MSPARAALGRRILLVIGAMFVLGFATAAYLRPEFIVDLSNRMIACF